MTVLESLGAGMSPAGVADDPLDIESHSLPTGERSLAFGNHRFEFACSCHFFELLNKGILVVFAEI